MITLDFAGPDWENWSLSPYGRARSWRLIDPSGTNFTAGDIQSLHSMILDLDWLRTRVHALEARRKAEAVYLTRDELATIAQAVGILGSLENLPALGKRSVYR